MERKLIRIKLAKTGTFGASGAVITVQMLKEVEETFDGKCPVSLGHYMAKQDWWPSWGNVETIALEVADDGQSAVLYGDVSINETLAEAIDNGMYPGWSISIPARAADGKHYLHHLAFLGAVPPKIRDLEIVKTSDGSVPDNAISATGEGTDFGDYAFFNSNLTQIMQFSSFPITNKGKRRVAGYARVSTERDEQQNSYEAQVNYYTSYIRSRDDWEFVDVYTDEGIFGTSTRHRDGFNRMIEDALAGKIDLILTKSVSRFTLNTVDGLTTIRKLKDKGVEVFFEKENIWTFDSKGEILLTIMSSLAQEESRSISENIKWGVRKRFEDGKFSLGYKSFLGYDKGPDGTLVVNLEGAKVVRLIYGLFITGKSTNHIAARLTEMGIPTPRGNKCWDPQHDQEHPSQ